MGRYSVPRCAALLLGVLLAVAGTEVVEVAAAQGSPAAKAKNACTLESTALVLKAQLKVPVEFSCPSGSTFKPEKAEAENLAALDDKTCSQKVLFSSLGLTATLSNPSGSNTRLGDQSANVQYVFTVTKLPPAESVICYVCDMPSTPKPGASNRVGPDDALGGSSSTTTCQVRIQVPADPSSASTPAPSTPAPSSSSTTSSASASSSGIGAFTGVLSVFLGLVKTYIL